MDLKPSNGMQNSSFSDVKILLDHRLQGEEEDPPQCRAQNNAEDDAQLGEPPADEQGGSV